MHRFSYWTGQNSRKDGGIKNKAGKILMFVNMGFLDSKNDVAYMKPKGYGVK